VRVFAGDLAKLDVIRVTWPNAVVQNWIDVATDKQIEVRESERLASSCPFLYVWNGQKFVYVTDVLGWARSANWLPTARASDPFPRSLSACPHWRQIPRATLFFQLTDEDARG